MIIIDEILSTPKSSRKPQGQRRSGARISGLPRAVSDSRFREMLQKKKNDKDRIEAEKQQRKQQREAAREETKKKKEEQQKRKKEEEEKAKLDKAKGTAMSQVATRKKKLKLPVIKAESSESSPSYDDTSEWSSEDEDWTEGSVNTCRECFKKFRGEEKRMAIGCDTEYCRRWYHRACIKDDFDQLCIRAR